MGWRRRLGAPAVGDSWIQPIRFLSAFCFFSPALFWHRAAGFAFLVGVPGKERLKSGENLHSENGQPSSVAGFRLDALVVKQVWGR